MKKLPIEDIVLKDLSARLPWSVKVLTPNDQEVYTLLALHPNKNIAVIGFEMDGMYVTSKVKIDDCKPLLSPMSSMTKEELDAYHNLCYEDEKEILECGVWFNKVYYYDTVDSIDYLNSIHVDYRGLIEKDLAIAVTEENNPYKTMEG